jgi:hypothetical protein
MVPPKHQSVPHDFEVLLSIQSWTEWSFSQVSYPSLRNGVAPTERPSPCTGWPGGLRGAMASSSVIRADDCDAASAYPEDTHGDMSEEQVRWRPTDLRSHRC